MSERDVRLYLDDILDSAQAIKTFVDGVDFEHFRTDRKTFSATIREFIVIGEAVGKLMNALVERFPEYDWRAIKDFRNMIVHEYFGVDERIVWDAIQYELDEVMSRLSTLRNEL